MDAVGELRSRVAEVERSDLPAPERDALLDELRSLEQHTLGEAERRASNEAKVAQAAVADSARSTLFSRALSLLREAAATRGVADDDLEAAGLPTAELLDELHEEGLLSEAVVGIAAPWKKELHPRGRGGKWRDVLKFGVAPARTHPAEREPNRVEKAVADARATEQKPTGEAHGTNLERKLASLGVDRGLLDEIAAAGLDGDRAERRRRSPLADEILGRARDTVELYTDPVSGEWDPARKVLHDRIVDSFLRERREVVTDEGTRHVLCSDCAYLQAPVNGKRRALFTAGGNASGKSTALAMPENAGVTPEHAAEIDFDQVKQELPEFKRMAAAHDIYGTDATHFESAHIARRVLDEAERRGLNVTVDSSGDSSTDHYEHTIRRLHDEGYETTVVMVDASLPLAAKSMISRARETGRYVPLPIMARVHQNSVAQHTRWRGSDAIDHWRLYHRGTEGGGASDMKLVAEGGAKMRELAPARRNEPIPSEPPAVSFKRATPAGFEKARAGNARAWNLSAKTHQDLKEAKLYVSKDGHSGFMVHDGDLQNLFNNGSQRGAGSAAVVKAVQEGARTLDAYDGFLPAYYARFGFVETGRMKFAPELAPDDMPEEDRLRAPDVVFMAYQGGDPMTLGSRVGTFPYTTSDVLERDWDAAKRRSAQAATDRGGGGRDDAGAGGRAGLPRPRGADPLGRGVRGGANSGDADRSGFAGRPGVLASRANPPMGYGVPYRVVDPAGYEAVLQKAPGATFTEAGQNTGPDVGVTA